ncbi:MAG: NAD-dependent epimerase/dehydratase family protein [Candidatus Limiplasma sp.]|nr:NAD-dependent epimerase/dehydratase family protein [Candidatus Limiplasma sp.]
MKTVVIGAYGHIGSYLVPRLVRDGHEVICISRGQSKPYTADPAWKRITHMSLDRNKEAKADFAGKIAALNADVVVDLINFTLEDTQHMVSALQGTRLSHYLFCSSIWEHGRTTLVPMKVQVPKHPLDEYGRQKAASAAYLHDAYLREGFPETVIMPGQICGPGWLIISPYGNNNVTVIERIARGEKIFLPNFGMETLNHIHADDVAQMFHKAIENRNRALGESFHAVAEESLTLYGYALFLYEYFNREPQIDFLSWERWCEYIGNPEETERAYLHIARSGHFSIENAKRLLGYQPKYTTRETVEISIQSYLDRGIIHAG